MPTTEHGKAVAARNATTHGLPAPIPPSSFPNRESGAGALGSALAPGLGPTALANRKAICYNCAWHWHASEKHLS